MKDKGFGFIVPDDGSDDVFFHRSRLSPKVYFEDLREGTEVQFEENLGREAGPMEKNIIAAVIGNDKPEDGSDDVFFHRSRLSPKVYFEDLRSKPWARGGTDGKKHHRCRLRVYRSR